jgi:hypothetical protein
MEPLIFSVFGALVLEKAALEITIKTYSDTTS